MKILVGIKRVIDYNVRVQVNRDGSGVVKDGVKMSINPFDEIAVEEALRMKERGDAAEVVVVSIGPDAASNSCAPRSPWAPTAPSCCRRMSACSRSPARALSRSMGNSEDPGLVMLGKQAIDDDANQVGQMLAALWDRPQATFVSKLEFSDGKLHRPRARWTPGLETIEVESAGRESRSTCG
jgi:electron transfer flavoprotein beta subunit